jgi:glutaredoxin 3
MLRRPATITASARVPAETAASVSVFIVELRALSVYLTLNAMAAYSIADWRDRRHPRNGSRPRALSNASLSIRQEHSMADAGKAILYRMVLADHSCPFGVRAKALLEAAGFQVDDRILRTREAVEAFEAELGVETTPQVFIAGERIGGCDALEAWLAGS